MLRKLTDITLTLWPDSTSRVFWVSNPYHFRSPRSSLKCLFLRLFLVFLIDSFQQFFFFPASWIWSGILKIPNAKQHLIIFLWKLSFLYFHVYFLILVISAWKCLWHACVGTNYKNRFVYSQDIYSLTANIKKKKIAIELQWLCCVWPPISQPIIQVGFGIGHFGSKKVFEIKIYWNLLEHWCEVVLDW